jgi:S-DNA-T family DNA segregation ATPase FtsK/SpoIIIE
LVLATQRPSVDIITGVIKANLPCRAAFQVVSKHDSRTILDQIGADKLLGNGDMLFQRPGSNRLERIQGAFISDEEVVRIVEATKKSMDSDYDEGVMEWIDSEVARVTDTMEAGGAGFDGEIDARFEEAKAIAQAQGSISASYLQRQLKIGYNRSARIVETMESLGLVDKADGVKPRKWLG